LIYTTNPIEGFHRQVRKYTKTKGAFTSENALFKLLFCAILNITNKWTMPLQNCVFQSIRALIPIIFEHPFQFKPRTDSNSNRAPIPIIFEH
jgi:transposase-like protein